MKKRTNDLFTILNTIYVFIKLGAGNE